MENDYDIYTPLDDICDGFCLDCDGGCAEADDDGKSQDIENGQ